MTPRSSGLQLGPYSLVAPIGAGGMGETMAEIKGVVSGLKHGAAMPVSPWRTAPLATGR